MKHYLAKSAWLVLLLAPLQSIASTLICNNPSDGHGLPHDNTMIVEHGASGSTLRFIGNEINELFSGSLQDLGGECDFILESQHCIVQFPVAGTMIRGEEIIVTAGRYEPGFKIFPDAGGRKVEVLFSGQPTGTEWWFQSCVSK